MAALREWRLTTARSDGVPAYVVAPDSLLPDIADQRPDDDPGPPPREGHGPVTPRPLRRGDPRDHRGAPFVMSAAQWVNRTTPAEEPRQRAATWIQTVFVSVYWSWAWSDLSWPPKPDCL